jgi:hypothetical protein
MGNEAEIIDVTEIPRMPRCNIYIFYLYFDPMKNLKILDQANESTKLRLSRAKMPSWLPGSPRSEATPKGDSSEP